MTKYVCPKITYVGNQAGLSNIYGRHTVHNVSAAMSLPIAMTDITAAITNAIAINDIVNNASPAIMAK